MPSKRYERAFSRIWTCENARSEIARQLHEGLPADDHIASFRCPHLSDVAVSGVREHRSLRVQIERRAVDKVGVGGRVVPGDLWSEIGMWRELQSTSEHLHRMAGQISNQHGHQY